MFDGLKISSSFGKVTYWNWNLAPDQGQYLTSDFIFMPEQWDAGTVEERYLRQANAVNYLDGEGRVSPSTMADILLGSNEPDIAGSCMGNMFGECTQACTDASVAVNDCPAASLNISGPRAHANSNGECNCWQFSHATGAGFWPFKGCASHQPLPTLWEDEGCVNAVMDHWFATARIAHWRGYKYLTTPLVAVDISYAEKFIERACGCEEGPDPKHPECKCTDASCGCPVYIGFHWYAFDCRPHEGGYVGLQKRLDDVRKVMEKYDFVKGAIVNEVGMLNCNPTEELPICVPNSGHYPAEDHPHNSCPSTTELPNGMASFVEQFMGIVAEAKTAKGKPVVKAVSWFNQDRAGGTYNLRLFDSAGNVNSVGEAYIRACQAWGNRLAKDLSLSSSSFNLMGGGGVR